MFMKFTILLDVLFELLEKRKVTATELAKKHGLSERTVYRYIHTLQDAVPVQIKRGREGGVCLPDSFTLPVGFFTEEEYAATTDALAAAYADTTEERYVRALKKLSAERRKEEAFCFESEGNVFVDCEATRTHADKLRVFERALCEKRVLELDDGKSQPLRVEPHALLFRDGCWQVFVFCHVKRRFRHFALDEVRSLSQTKECFHPRPFHRLDVLS